MVQQLGASLERLYYLAYGDTIYYWVPSRHSAHTDNYPDTVKHPMLGSSYGNYWYKPILEVADKERFKMDEHLLVNRYNYSLIVPENKASAKSMQEWMQSDLKNYFGYDAKVEIRPMPYWKLLASPDAINILKTKSPGNKFKATQINDTLYHYSNAIIKDILIRMIFNFSFGFVKPGYGIIPKEEGPFVDETGISCEIDYDISNREFEEMQKGNWDIALAFLKRNGLSLVKSQRLTKVVVIRDPQKF